MILSIILLKGGKRIAVLFIYLSHIIKNSKAYKIKLFTLYIFFQPQVREALSACNEQSIPLDRYKAEFGRSLFILTKLIR